MVYMMVYFLSCGYSIGFCKGCDQSAVVGYIYDFYEEASRDLSFFANVSFQLFFSRLPD